jgi:hypothetical protein
MEIGSNILGRYDTSSGIDLITTGQTTTTTGTTTTAA